MRNGIVVAIAFSAVPFFACSNDSTPNAADTESQKGSFVHVLQGKYVIDKNKQILAMTSNGTAEECVPKGDGYSWEKVSQTDSVEYEFVGDSLVLYTVSNGYTANLGLVYVGGNMDDLGGTWTYTGCTYDNDKNQTECYASEVDYKTVTLALSKGEFTKKKDSRFDEYLADFEAAGYTSSLFMNSLYTILAGEESPAPFRWFFEPGELHYNVEVIENSKTSQTFVLNGKTYTFKVNNVKQSLERNGLLSVDLNLEVSDGSTTCVGYYTQQLVDKDLCNTHPQGNGFVDDDGEYHRFLPDTGNKGAMSRDRDFYVTSNEDKFIKCLKSIVANNPESGT